MPLSMIRDAAIGAGYSSPAELEQWLSRAVGGHYRYLKHSLDHAKAAVALCPLQGEGYMYLGELCFLDLDHKAQTWDFVEQALRVRPHNGTVLFHAGREAWLAGRKDQSLDFWLKSYNAGPIYQRQLIDWTAGRISLEFILSCFQPNLEVLKYMQHRYRSIAEPAELTPLLEAIAQAAQAQAQVERVGGKPEAAAESWLSAMSAYHEMLRLEDAAVCGRRAIECNPHSFDARYRLGFLLSEIGQYAEADVHLAWCSRKEPGHAKLNRRLRDVKRMILDPEGSDSRRLGAFYPPVTDFMEARLQVAAGGEGAESDRRSASPQAELLETGLLGQGRSPFHPPADATAPATATGHRAATPTYLR